MHQHPSLPSNQSSGDATEYMLHALFEGENTYFRMGETGQPLNHEVKLYLPTEEAKKRLWKHTDEFTAGLNMILPNDFVHDSFEFIPPFPTCLQAR